MATTDKKLQREIDLENLLKSDNRKKFEKEHTICYGLYDDEGLEALTKVKEITVDTLGQISSAETAYSVRARMNSHRNTKSYVMWVHNNSLHLICKLMEKGDYMRAKALLLKHGHKC